MGIYAYAIIAYIYIYDIILYVYMYISTSTIHLSKESSAFLLLFSRLQNLAKGVSKKTRWWLNQPL